MNDARITINDENYEVMDTTVGQYVNRAEGNPIQTWITCWSKDFELISLKLDRIDLTATLAAKEKTHYDYNKAVRAKNRHLKVLKEHLGLIAPKKETNGKVKVFYRSRAGYATMSDIQESEAIVHDKTIEIGNMKYKKHAIDCVLMTEEKASLVNEYNQKLAEFNAFKKEMLGKIFDEDGIE